MNKEIASSLDLKWVQKMFTEVVHSYDESFLIVSDVLSHRCFVRCMINLITIYPLNTLLRLNEDLLSLIAMFSFISIKEILLSKDCFISRVNESLANLDSFRDHADMDFLWQLEATLYRVKESLNLIVCISL